MAISIGLLPLAGGLLLPAVAPEWGAPPAPPLAALLAGPSEHFERVLLPFAGVAFVASLLVLWLGPPGPQPMSARASRIISFVGRTR